MPLYDYRCDNCTHEEEILQGMNDERLTVCPACKQSAFKRKASAPAFAFKGGGWYKDLYGSASSGGSSSSSTPAASESKPSTSESKATGSSDSGSSSATSTSSAPAATT